MRCCLLCDMESRITHKPLTWCIAMHFSCTKQKRLLQNMSPPRARQGVDVGHRDAPNEIFICQQLQTASIKVHRASGVENKQTKAVTLVPH